MRRRSGFLDYGGCGCCLLVPLLTPLLVPFWFIFAPVFSAIGANLEGIDIDNEKARMQNNIVGQIIGVPMLGGLLFFFFYLFSKTSNQTFDPSDFYPVVTLFGVFMVLCVVSSTLKYLILRYRTKSRR